MTCGDVDRLMTPFIDDTCSAADRAGVLAHLEQCRDCRARAEAESTARHVLQAHAAVARTLGVSPPWWRPRVFRLGRPTLPMAPPVLLVGAIVVAAAFGWWLQPTPVTAVGIITDSFCNGRHGQFTREFAVSESECTLGCIARGAEFVLVTDTGVYRIRNQEMPQLPTFASQRVKVDGTMADGAIVVQQLAAADAGHAQ